jgi:hypothetical protein
MRCSSAARWLDDLLEGDLRSTTAESWQFPGSANSGPSTLERAESVAKRCPTSCEQVSHDAGSHHAGWRYSEPGIVFGEGPSWSNVTWSMTAYIPILPPFAITTLGASESSKIVAARKSAASIGLMEPCLFDARLPLDAPGLVFFRRSISSCLFASGGFTS